MKKVILAILALALIGSGGPDGQWATALGLSLLYAGGEDASPREDEPGGGGWLGRLRGRLRRPSRPEELAAEA